MHNTINTKPHDRKIKVENNRKEKERRIKINDQACF